MPDIELADCLDHLCRPGQAVSYDRFPISAYSHSSCTCNCLDGARIALIHQILDDGAGAAVLRVPKHIVHSVTTPPPRFARNRLGTLCSCDQVLFDWRTAIPTKKLSSAASPQRNGTQQATQSCHDLLARRCPGLLAGQDAVDIRMRFAQVARLRHRVNEWRAVEGSSNCSSPQSIPRPVLPESFHPAACALQGRVKVWRRRRIQGRPPMAARGRGASP